MSEVNCSLCGEEFNPFIEGQIIGLNDYVCDDCMNKAHREMHENYVKKKIAKRKKALE